MAFSASPHNPHPLINSNPPSSSFSFLSLQPHTHFLPSSFKPLRFKPCCCSQTQTDTNHITLDFEAQKRKRKPKPSFYDQIREKWSQKPLSQTKKLPWQLPQEEEEELEEEEGSSELEMVSDPVSSDFESHKDFGQLVVRSEIEEKPIVSERKFDRTLSNIVNDPVNSGLDNRLGSASLAERSKITSTHFDNVTKTGQNFDGDNCNGLGLNGVLANNLAHENNDIDEEVGTSGNVEEVQVEKLTLSTSKFDVHSGASLSSKVDKVETKKNKASFEGSAQEKGVDRLPWVSGRDTDKEEEERRKMSKTELAEKMIPEHELKKRGEKGVDRLPWVSGRDTDKEEEERRKMSKTELAEKMIPEHELKRLRNAALRMKERIKVGPAGVTQALVDTIHGKWKLDEVVKLRFEGPSSLNMKRMHEVLESKTGGLVIWRSGSSVVLYRGLNYKLGCVQTYVAEKIDVLRDPEPDSMRLPKDFSEEELKNMSELNDMLNGLGPRYVDWSGCPPPPVDADLLPGFVRGYKTPFRLLPHGVRHSLRDDETTRIRRLARTMPPHFALGRNRELQGLAAAMVKLWEKSAIAKIAIKRGVLNTNNERMAEQLKRMTGGTLLSRNKEYIVFYRGNDFLTPSVTEALKEREKLTMLQYEEEEARRYASALINSNSKNYKTPMVAGTLAETVAATSRWGKQPSKEEVEQMLKDLAVARHASLVKFLENKLAIAKGKIKKAEKALAKVQESLEPEDLPTDLETITDEERLVFRRMGLSMKPFLLLGRREVFDGTIENMHLHWKFREVVKIIVRGKNFSQVKHIAISLEAESGGVLVSIDKTTKGYAIILYRGKNYQRPLKLRPRNLLTRRQALARSIELQRREGLKHHISDLHEQIELMRSGLEDVKDGKEIDDKTFYEKLDDSAIPSDDDTDEDEDEEAYLQTYDSGDENGVV